MHIYFYITVAGVGSTAADRDNKQLILKNWTSFTDCASQKNNRYEDNVKDLHLDVDVKFNRIIPILQR